MAFDLAMYPIVYMARYNAQTSSWEEKWLENDGLSYDALMKMPDSERAEVYRKRNFMQLPTVSYTSQYGIGCFEGMKAFATMDGGVSIFRPDRNARRFADSMRGLLCPPFPEEMFIKASVEFVRKNSELGYVPPYNSEWEKDNYASAASVYIRPFMYSEAGVGVEIPKEPVVAICATSVSTYFKGGNTKATTTKRIRATPNGTGWIKCCSNYAISAIAKKEAEDAGFMEVVYLDSEEKKYIQEGSSCNIFFILKDGTLVTPELGDTILPGITRASVIDLAQDEGIKVEERKISIDEVMADTIECFVTGTAAGITPIESITHDGKEAVFNNRKPGEVGARIQRLLKGGQYGLIPFTRPWNTKVL